LLTIWQLVFDDGHFLFKFRRQAKLTADDDEDAVASLASNEGVFEFPVNDRVHIRENEVVVAEQDDGAFLHLATDNSVEWRERALRISDGFAIFGIGDTFGD
jgi:hypothetical protein